MKLFLTTLASFPAFSLGSIIISGVEQDSIILKNKIYYSNKFSIFNFI